MKYIVNRPLKFIDQFNFYKDDTPWEGEYKGIIKIDNKTEKTSYYPKYKNDFREKASYKKYLKLKNESIKNQLSSGLYLLFFCDFNSIMLELLQVILKIDYLNTLLKFLVALLGEV